MSALISFRINMYKQVYIANVGIEVSAYYFHW